MIHEGHVPHLANFYPKETRPNNLNKVTNTWMAPPCWQPIFLSDPKKKKPATFQNKISKSSFHTLPWFQLTRVTQRSYLCQSSYICLTSSCCHIHATCHVSNVSLGLNLAGPDPITCLKLVMSAPSICHVCSHFSTTSTQPPNMPREHFCHVSQWHQHDISYKIHATLFGSDTLYRTTFSNCAKSLEVYFKFNESTSFLPLV